jgi:hypothetical protein
VSAPSDIKTGVDLGDFAIPIDNLLDPGMTRGALAKLDQHLEKTGYAPPQTHITVRHILDESLSTAVS